MKKRIPNILKDKLKNARDKAGLTWVLAQQTSSISRI